MLEVVVFYLCAGAMVGVLSGLFGIGGGLVVVPTLLFCLPRQGVGADIVAHLAIGTSHATIIFTALASSISYQKKRNIDWGIVKGLAPGLVIGALFIGSSIAKYLPADLLRTVFSIFVFIMAIKLVLIKKIVHEHFLPNAYVLSFIAGVIGTFSAVLGIGGGSITVPYLCWRGVGVRRAIGTSVTCACLIAICSSIGFVISGIGRNDLPEYSIGFIYIPALVGIISSSMIFVKIGTKFAHNISEKRQKMAFALLLMVVGIKMLIN